MSSKLVSVGTILLTLPLGACPDSPKNYSLTAETGFAKTAAGYVNSGIWTKGHLFIWDRQAQTIRFLAEIELVDSDVARVETNGSMSASNIQGINLKGGAEVPDIVKVTATTDLENKSSIDLTNYATDGLKNPTVVLANHLNKVLGGLDRDLQESALLLKESVNNDRYRYLFTTKLIRADKAEFVYNGTVASGLEVKIPMPAIGANVSASVKNEAMTKFNGKATAVLVDFAVYKLTLVTQGNNQFYSFVLDAAIPMQNFSTELRRGV